MADGKTPVNTADASAEAEESVKAQLASMMGHTANEAEIRKKEIEKDLRERTHKLKSDVEDFAETLEDNSDKWFDNPCGWMLGPGVKRSADIEKSANGQSKGGISKLLGGLGTKTYTKRWFVLDVASRTLKYYKDEKARIENGCIDMTTVIDIQACTDPDAPNLAIDLVGRGGRCSIAGVNYKEVVRWVFVLEEVIKSFQKPSPNSPLGSARSNDSRIYSPRNKAESDEEKRWFRYSYTFQEPGPLMVNVVGLTDQDSMGNIQSHWLLVTSFARHPDGKLGAAEKSNIIKIKDYIVGVNNMDLTPLPYSEAMTAMRSATFPKTVYFLRDLQTKQETVYCEGWVYAFYPSLNRKRKRYVELDSDSINFRKPAPGGSTSSKRDVFFAIDQIAYVKPMTDPSAAEDAKHLLRIVCNPGSLIQQLGIDDIVVGNITLETLDLYFRQEEERNNWIKFLSVSSLRPRRIGGVAIDDIQVTEHEFVEREADMDFEEVLGIRSYVSGTFAPRAFAITDDGYLVWKSPTNLPSLKGTKKALDSYAHRGRRVFLANSRTCALRSVYAVTDDSPTTDPNYAYQLMIQDINQMVWIGFPDEHTLMKWVSMIGSVVEKSPEESRAFLTIPTYCLPLSVVMSMVEQSLNQEEEEPTFEEEKTSSVANRNRQGSIFNFLASQKDNTDNTKLTSLFQWSKGAPKNADPDAAGAGEGSGTTSGFVVQSSRDPTARNRTDSFITRAGARVSMSFMNLNAPPVSEDESMVEYVGGYLFYKHNSKVKRSFSKYWFSLRGYKLFYYKERVRAKVTSVVRDSGQPVTQIPTNRPIDYIDLLEVLEVRESTDPSAPENALEIVTPSRVYQLTASDEDQFLRWLDALSETLEMRKEAVHKESTATIAKSPAERINELKKSILYEGGLSLKEVNKITNFVSWKEKYYVIAKGGLLEFESKSDVFLSEKYKEIISIPAILSVVSSEEPNCMLGCAFDVQAYVPRGGDKNGMRIFTFEAQTSNLCREWMTQLCDATGSLQLKSSDDGYSSVVADSVRKKKDSLLSRAREQFVVKSKITGVNVDEDDFGGNTSRKPLSNDPASSPSQSRPAEMVRVGGGRGPLAGGRGRGVAFQGGGRGLPRPGVAASSSLAAAPTAGTTDEAPRETTETATPRPGDEENTVKDDDENAMNEAPEADLPMNQESSLDQLPESESL